MKVGLVSINAKYIHTNNAVRLLKANSTFDIDILEYTIKDDINQIINDIYQSQYDVIGFSTYIWNIEIVKRILSTLKKDDMVIVLGGPEASYDAYKLLKEYSVNYVIKGEGEVSFQSLLEALSNNHDTALIPNIAYVHEGTFINNDILEIHHLQKIKSPHYFEEDIPHIKNKISYIESSRGCPYKCSYCLSSLEKTVRFFPISDVKKTIQYLMDKGAKTIKFLDRTFNANKNTLDLFDFIINNHNGATVFQFEITGDILDDKIIEYINKYGKRNIFRFEIGIQSTNKETNLLVDRYQDNEKLFSNIKLIQEGGIIDLHLDLIAGLPKENISSFINTFDEVFKLGAKELQLGFLKMLKGTKIRNQASLYGYQYNQNAPYEIIQNNDLSKEDISRIQLVEEMLDIYHNKGHFRFQMLSYLINQKSPFLFLESLGRYYQRNNYSFKGYQITDIYQRIINFVGTNKFKDAILIDYLQRSKIKPKVFWENTISKAPIITKLSKEAGLNINLLHKHSVVIKHESLYHVFVYQHLKVSHYKVNEKGIV